MKIETIMAIAHQYKVEGISCINCANGIQSHLNKKNINKVHIDIASGLVTIYSEQYTAKEIAAFINELGYTVKLNELDQKPSYKLEYYLAVTTLLSIPLLAHMFVDHQHILNNPWLQLLLSTPIMIIGYLYFFKSAYNSLKNLKPNMNVLILMGSTSAYVYSLAGWALHFNSPQAHQFLFFETAATIITLVLLGNYFEKKSIKQTTTALDALQGLQLKTATKELDGKLIKCLISDLTIGDVIIVNQGDSLPIDGEIVWGEGSINESMISGESSPSFKSTGQKVIGGTLLLEGNLKVRVSTNVENTVLSQIIQMVRNAQEDKPQIQKLGDRISSIFVPAVITIASITFLVNYIGFSVDLQDSMLRAVAVLVISCPCAMGLATPTAVMVGVGRAAKNGILIKGGATIERFSKTEKVIFDKTGTLTDGNFKIHELLKLTEDYDVESIIYELEKHSSHPIAKSLVKSLASVKKPMSFASIEEVKGKGFNAQDLNLNSYQFGSSKFTEIEDKVLESKYQLFLKVNGQLIAALAISDEIKEGAKALVAFLNTKGIETTLLSGDKQQKCKTLAKELNIQEIYANQLPQDKIKKVKEFSVHKKTTMFGDGINDAPALTQADVGISYSKATEVAVQSSAIVLLNHKLDLVQKAYQICTHTYLTIKQNLFWAFAYNIIAIPLAAMGYLSPIFAAFAMAFSDIVVIGNSIRLKYKNINS